MSGDDAAGTIRPVIRPAVPADLPAVLALIEAASLPTAGVAEWLLHYRVAEEDGVIVGVAGVEIYGDGALLRSVAVSDAIKGRGTGRLLVEAALEHAARAAAPEVWLLTTTADRWFPRFGFRKADRSDAPPGVAGSIEFREACPASAVAMVLGPEGLSRSVDPAAPSRPRPSADP